MTDPRPGRWRRAAAATLALLASGALSHAAGERGEVRLVRSTSGGTGKIQGNRYVVDDPRAVFQAGRDRQVVVVFEWEGSPGSHEGKASWKDPSGAVVLTSPFQSTASTARFSVYWTLALPEAPRLGLWALEAEVDGQPAGVHTFQIQGATEAVGTATTPTLPPAELYARSRAAMLTVESFDQRGTRLAVGTGFLVGERLVVTAFQVIEGAARVRMGTPDGGSLETDELAAWNRRQDWAVCRTPELTATRLPINRTAKPRVGDRGSFLDVGEDGSRVMADVAIVGVQDFPQAGPRLSISAPANTRSLGGALLNPQGEAIAVLGGTMIPGFGLANLGSRSFTPVSLSGLNTMAVPLSTISAALSEPGTKLTDLLARGVFAPPLVGAEDVITGTLARQVEMRNNIPIPAGEKSEFTRSEGEVTAFLTLDPQRRRKGLAVFRIFDADNRALMEGKPFKLDVRARDYSVLRWTFPLGRLQPGVHRIDLFVDADPIWRTYFRVLD
jgi:S1-C subfamily serine protease